MKRFCLALDLKDYATCIAEYDRYHQEVWPTVLESLRACGINEMKIYRTGNRLVMFINTTDDFSFERKKQMDEANPEVQRWETIMSTLQQRIPWAEPEVKWIQLKEVFSFNS